MSDLGTYVDAFEQSIRSTIDLAGSLDGNDWRRPTDLPGWTVHDTVAHLAAVERELLGHPRPPRLATYGPHVRSAFGRHMEDGVAARRDRSSAEVVAELADALELRLPQMRSMRPEDAPVRVPAGERWSVEQLLRNRAVDAWMHEQDVRRAVGRPGNLDGPGASVVRHVALGALPLLVAKRAGAGPGQSVRLDVVGAQSFTATVVVGEDGRGVLTAGEVADPSAVIALDWEALVRLFGGRRQAAEVPVDVSGDEGLAGRVLGSLAVTP